jgi:phosphate transport system substrate-binding protein
MLSLGLSGIVEGAEPEVLTVDFAAANPHRPDLPSWVESIDIRAGSITNGVWTIPASAPVGLGQIDVYLDPFADVRGIAITLAAEESKDSDLSIHLYNASGELIAVDLFGNLFDSARAGHTDTFVVSLTKFPDVARVSVRRIKGPLALRGMVAFPVIEALQDLTPEQNETLAKMLGERLAAWDSSSKGMSIPFRNSEDRRATNSASSVLDHPNYPERSLDLDLSPEKAFTIASAGSCYRFATNLYLTLFPFLESADKVSFVSSTQAMRSVISTGAGVALTSVPPTADEFAKYQSQWGRPLLVVPIASDAVEVIVHPSNGMTEVSFETLRRIFGDVLGRRATWGDFAASGLSGEIQVAGGHPSWGTSRLFAERVLAGASLREDLVTLDIAFPHGVEAFVAKNPNAIGFAQHRTRTHPIRSLRLSENGSAVAVSSTTVNDGTYPLSRNLYMIVAPDAAGVVPEATRHFADLLLSREGQRMIATAGSFPLSAQAVENSRRQLGLP